MVARTGLLPERYAHVEPIARGGMGEIYRATDTELGRAVAVKVLTDRYAEDVSVRERFKREALAAARLSSSPNIVTIYDVGEWAGRPYIVMECLGGGSLEEVLRDSAGVAPGRALAWLEQTAAALDAAHAHGVVHRDVKPANLLLDAQGQVHVVDFGIASAAGLDSLTLTGTVLGTASYLSPEQAQGGRASAASDCYSLAVVAFELLTGRRPFEGATAAAEAAAHVSGRVPSVRTFEPSLPAALDDVFARALAKDPARRFASCSDFVAALRAAFDRDAGATGVIAPARIVRPRRRGPVLAALALAALLALGGWLAASRLAGGGRHAGAPVVRTVTQRGTTVRETVTAPAPTTAASPPATPAGQSGDALNAQGYDLMKRGDYADALPLLEQAVQKLQGQTADVSDGYANYNLGVTLIALHRCADAMTYLQAARQIEPGRHEVQDAMKIARRCS